MGKTLIVKMGKEHRALLKVVAKSQARPGLTGVRVTSRVAEAIDGYMLLRMPVECLEEGAGGVIPARALALGLTGLKEKEQATVTIADGTVEIEHGDILVKAALVNGAFPATDKLIVARKSHDGVETFAIGVEPKYLKRVAEIAQAIGSEYVRFQLSAPTKAIGVHFASDGHAVVMPRFIGPQ